MNQNEQTVSHAVSKESMAFRISAIVGLGAMLATLLVYSAAITPFQSFETLASFVGTFAETSLSFAAVFSFIFIVAALFGKQVPHKVLLVLGGVLYSASAFIFLHFVWYGNEDIVTTLAGGALAGMADVMMCLLWGRIFMRFTLKSALVNVSIACIVSAVIYWLLTVLPPFGSIIVFAVCSLVAAALPAVLDVPTVEAAATSAQLHAQKALDTLRSFADVIVTPALGLLFFAFAMGTMRSAFTERFETYLFAVVFAALILIVYALTHTRPFTMRALQQTFVPLLAIILLAATSISTPLKQGSEVLMFLTFLLYLFAAILTLSILCAIANAAEFTPDLIFGMAVLLFALASITGLKVSEMIDEEMIGVAITITTTIYAFAMVLFSYFKWQRNTAWDNGENPGKAEGDSLSDRCEKIAAEYRLTAREQEILSYLAEGHSGAYISEV
ncbi:MAG: LuxR family transcriptional regulator, partial [Raoultibacter sp.]